MGVGRGQGGLGLPWFLKISAKKDCFPSFEWVKPNFTTFSPPGKIFEKSPCGPPGKNPSDNHAQSDAGSSPHFATFTNGLEQTQFPANFETRLRLFREILPLNLSIFEIIFIALYHMKFH